MNIRVRAEHVAVRRAVHHARAVAARRRRARESLGGGDALDLRDTLDGCDDCVVQDNDIGWTKQDETTATAATAAGCSATTTGCCCVRNKIHDCEADGIQGVRGDDVVIDRNEIGPVGDDPACPYGAYASTRTASRSTAATGP